MKLFKVLIVNDLLQTPSPGMVLGKSRFLTWRGYQVSAAYALVTAAYAWKTMGGHKTLTHREESREQCDARQK